MGNWSDDEKQRAHDREVAFNLGAQSRDAEIAALRARLADVLWLMPGADVPAIAFAGHHGGYVRAVVDAVCSERDALRARAEKADKEKALRGQVEREREAACKEREAACKERDAALAANAALREATQARLAGFLGWGVVSRSHRETHDEVVRLVADLDAALAAPTPDVVVLTREEADRLDRFLLWSEPPMEEVEKHRALLRRKVKP